MDPQTTLDDPSRQKLDGIVQQMTQNKESDNNIQAVVNDFKQKYSKPKQRFVDSTPQNPLGGMVNDVQQVLGGANKVVGAIGQNFRQNINAIPQDIGAAKQPADMAQSLLRAGGHLAGAVASPITAPVGAAVQDIGNKMGSTQDLQKIVMNPTVRPILDSIMSHVDQFGKSDVGQNLSSMLNILGLIAAPDVAKQAKGDIMGTPQQGPSPSDIGQSFVNNTVMQLDHYGNTELSNAIKQIDPSTIASHQDIINAVNQIPGAAQDQSVQNWLGTSKQLFDTYQPAQKGLIGAAGEAAQSVGGQLSGMASRVSDSAAAPTNDLTQLQDMVSPRLTAKEAEGAQTTTSRFTKKVSVVPDKRTTDLAKTAQGILDTSKTFSENATLAENAIATEAEQLKSNIKTADHPVPRQELKADLRGIERPVMITSDTTMNNAYSNVLKKANSIIDSMDGTVSGLLDGRKAFDAFVQQQFPNLYQSDTMTPMRTAIKGVRSAWNDFTASQLPNDVGFQDSLSKQNKLFDITETLREKAARGAPTQQGEIGTNRFQRFNKAHPNVKKAIGYGAAGLVGVEGAKHLLP